MIFVTALCALRVAGMHVKYSGYYFDSIQEKLEESTSIGSCQIVVEENRSYFSFAATHNIVHVSILSPSVSAKPNTPQTHVLQTPSYMSPHLCYSGEMRAYIANRKKLCTREMLASLSPPSRRKRGGMQAVTGLQKRGLEKTVSVLHPGHPRCDQGMALVQCKAQPNGMHDAMRYLYRTSQRIKLTSSFLLHISAINSRGYNSTVSFSRTNRSIFDYLQSSVFISSTGMLVMTQCNGVIGHLNPCSAEKRAVPQTLLEFQATNEASASAGHRRSFGQLMSLARMAKREVLSEERFPKSKLPMLYAAIEKHTVQAKSYDRVFVLTQYDDNQIGQFILEVLPKCVYYLQFLTKNPDVFIHFGYNGVVDSRALKYFNLLNLTHRIVSGIVCWISFEEAGSDQSPCISSRSVLSERRIMSRCAL